MGPIIMYGTLYSVWGSFEYMEPLVCMEPFKVYGAI